MVRGSGLRCVYAFGKFFGPPSLSWLARTSRQTSGKIYQKNAGQQQNVKLERDAYVSMPFSVRHHTILAVCMQDLGSDLISTTNNQELFIVEMRFEPSDAQFDGSEVCSTVLRTLLYSTIPQFMYADITSRPFINIIFAEEIIHGE